MFRHINLCILVTFCLGGQPHTPQPYPQEYYYPQGYSYSVPYNKGKFYSYQQSQEQYTPSLSVPTTPTMRKPLKVRDPNTKQEVDLNSLASKDSVEKPVETSEVQPTSEPQTPVKESRKVEPEIQEEAPQTPIPETRPKTPVEEPTSVETPVPVVEEVEETTPENETLETAQPEEVKTDIEKSEPPKRKVYTKEELLVFRRTVQNRDISKKIGEIKDIKNEMIHNLAENPWLRIKDRTKEMTYRSLVNKLTPETYDRLLKKTLAVPIEGNNMNYILLGDVVFDKALLDPKYAGIYAQFCYDLDHSIPRDLECTTEEGKTIKIKDFKQIIVNKCGHEFNRVVSTFDNASQATLEEYNDLKGPINDDELIRITSIIKQKEKNVSLMKFIGELFNLCLLSPKRMILCLTVLLKNGSFEEAHEHFHMLYKTVGANLEKTREWNVAGPEIIKEIEALSENKEIKPRVKFLFQNLVDLRKSGWIERDSDKQAGPKKLRDLRSDLERSEREKSTPKKIHTPSPRRGMSASGEWETPKRKGPKSKQRQERTPTSKRKEYTSSNSYDVFKTPTSTPTSTPTTTPTTTPAPIDVDEAVDVIKKFIIDLDAEAAVDKYKLIEESISESKKSEILEDLLNSSFDRAKLDIIQSTAQFFGELITKLGCKSIVLNLLEAQLGILDELAIDIPKCVDFFYTTIAQLISTNALTFEDIASAVSGSKSSYHAKLEEKLKSTA